MRLTTIFYDSLVFFRASYILTLIASRKDKVKYFAHLGGHHLEQKFIYFLWLLIGVTILAGSILQAQQIKRGGNRHFEALLNHSNLQKL